MDNFKDMSTTSMSLTSEEYENKIIVLKQENLLQKKEIEKLKLVLYGSLKDKQRNMKNLGLKNERK